jgi:hypothetical protein
MKASPPIDRPTKARSDQLRETAQVMSSSNGMTIHQGVFRIP